MSWSSTTGVQFCRSDTKESRTTSYFGINFRPNGSCTKSNVLVRVQPCWFPSLSITGCDALSNQQAMLRHWHPKLVFGSSHRIQVLSLRLTQTFKVLTEYSKLWLCVLKNDAADGRHFNVWDSGVFNDAGTVRNSGFSTIRRKF